MTNKKLSDNVSSPYSKEDQTHCSAEALNTPQERRRLLDTSYQSSHIKNLEQVALAKQEWEFTADLMPQLICLVNQAGYIIRANRTVERWNLGKVAEVRGLTMHELLHPNCNDAACYQSVFWETPAGTVGTSKSTEYQIEDAFLQRYLHLSFHSPHVNQTNHARIRFGVAVVSDISDLKHAEKKLKVLNYELEARVEARTSELLQANLLLKQEIEERTQLEAELKKSRVEFRLLVETMSEGLMICNKQGLISYINDRLCEMLKRTREEIIGHAPLEFIEASSQALWNQLATKLKGGYVTSEELRLQGPTKPKTPTVPKPPEVWAKVSPSPLLDQNGEIAGSFAVFTDISERIQTEHALRASERQLRLLSQMVMSAQEQERQRLSSELHDGIGQTLSAVKFYVETGIQALDEQLSEESVQKLRNVIPKIQDAIVEVRRISMALRPSMLDDIGILATLTWFCRESALVYKSMAIQLQLDIKEEFVPFQIKVVIFRIVQEAFNNAVKHSRAERMRISLKHTGEAIELDLEDNGIGFDTKATNRNGNKASGGLGLNSMRERAEFSEGFYLMESSAKGTRIRVTWPIQPT